MITLCTKGAHTHIKLVNFPNIREVLTLEEKELEDGRHEPLYQLLDQLELLRNQLLAEVRVVRFEECSPTCRYIPGL